MLLKENSGSISNTDIKSNKKDKNAIKITLINPNNSIIVTTLEDAQKLSKRRELKLVKIQDLDTKTQRPVYRLYTAAELLSEEESENNNPEDTAKSSHKKTEKNLTLNSRIADHDLTSRIKNITKWLIKGHEIRVLIQSNSSQDDVNSENIFKKIETAIKEINNGKIVQKRSKNGNIKFNIVPITTTTSSSSSSSSTKTTNKNELS